MKIIWNVIDYWRVVLKLKWTNYCVLSANGHDNTDADPSNTTLTIEDISFYFFYFCPIVTVSPKNNQNLSKLFRKGFERSLYWINIIKIENKIMTNKYRYFFKWNFIVVNKLFVLIYWKKDDNAKTYELSKCYLQKCIAKNYNVILI